MLIKNINNVDNYYNLLLLKITSLNILIFYFIKMINLYNQYIILRAHKRIQY